MVKVSIIVPLYNVGQYLKQCVESFINQSLQDIEIILIDDGSPDDSGQIANGFVAADSRISVIHKKNAGVGAARNDGLAVAKGEYVIFCDGDDWMDTFACEKLYEAAQAAAADVCIGDVFLTYPDKSEQRVVFYDKAFVAHDKDEIKDLIRADIYRTYCTRPSDTGAAFGYGGPWNKLVKRSLLMEHNVQFDTRVRGVFDDIIYTAHILAAAKKVCYIQYPMYHYRQLESSITHRYSPSVLEINSEIFNSWEEFFDEYEENQEFRKPYYASVIRRMNESMRLYFVNVKNPLDTISLQSKFRTLIRTQPYRDALANVELRKLSSKKEKLLVILSKLRLIPLLWRVYA